MTSIHTEASEPSEMRLYNAKLVTGGSARAVLPRFFEKSSEKTEIFEEKVLDFSIFQC